LSTPLLVLILVQFRNLNYHSYSRHVLGKFFRFYSRSRERLLIFIVHVLVLIHANITACAMQLLDNADPGRERQNSSFAVPESATKNGRSNHRRRVDYELLMHPLMKTDPNFVVNWVYVGAVGQRSGDLKFNSGVAYS